jgi:hypothetical protein
MLCQLKVGESLTAVLAGAITATNPTYAVAWRGPGLNNPVGSLTGATAVTLVSAPTDANERIVDFIRVYNADSADATVTIAKTSVTMFVVTLSAGYTLIADDNGVRVINASGQITDASTLNNAVTAALTTTDGVALGTARRVGGVAFREVAASTAITGTTETEANFDQKYTVPANTLKVGTCVRIRAQGIHTATSGSEDHTILLKIGTTTLCSKAAVDPANSDLFYFDFEFVVRTAGAGGTMVGAGVIATGPSGTAAANAVLLASTAVDTTGALDIAVAIDRQASATDGDSARLDYLTVEIIG